MAEFTKSERRVLRQIAEEVYEAEAHQMLEQLHAKFRSWRDGGLLSSELIREIHELHQNDSRDLWSVYRVLGEASIVARGIALGLIPESRVPSEILAKLAPTVDFHNRWGVESESEDDDED
jgi:hypothetical protein